MLLSHCRGWTILTRRQNVTADCLNFAKSHLAVPDSGVAWLWQNFNNLLSILPPRQNNPVAAVSVIDISKIVILLPFLDTSSACYLKNYHFWCFVYADCRKGIIFQVYSVHAWHTNSN